MKNKSPIFLALTVIFLICGNLIGAGILGLPVKTGLAGFYPALLAMLVCGGAMFYTAVVLGGEAIRSKEETFNYPSLYGHYLGPIGKWLAILSNMLILYGLLIAYLSGGATIINILLPFKIPHEVLMVIFFLLITTFTLTGFTIARKYNSLLIVVMWAAFIVIVIMAERYVKPTRLEYTNWVFLPATFPIVITAFHFHNIIPTICHTLNWKRTTIVTVMLIGMLIGYLMNAVWVEVGVGALPMEKGSNSLLNAYEKELPATIPLSREIKTGDFVAISMIFTLLAISTSYLANGLGLMDFIKDLTKNHLHIHSRVLDIALSFGPPLIIAALFRNIFLSALNIVGGIGIVMLFGILPGVIAVKRAATTGKKVLAYSILTLFSLFFILEICQEVGLLRLKPHVEHWQHELHKHKIEKRS
ncbi:MAG: aromatic amino acid transport family protein [Candidatus Auribacterota bacterium]|nr:aromatic amino acid transport family protein [Candidatus Auribacterota bacterium]